MKHFPGFSPTHNYLVWTLLQFETLWNPDSQEMFRKNRRNVHRFKQTFGSVVFDASQHDNHCKSKSSPCFNLAHQAYNNTDRVEGWLCNRRYHATNDIWCIMRGHAHGLLTRHIQNSRSSSSFYVSVSWLEAKDALIQGPEIPKCILVWHMGFCLNEYG